MFARLENFLSKHFETVGIFLVVSGLIWLMSAASEADLNVYGPIFPFIVKTSIGLAGLVGGAFVLLGGGPDED